MPVKIGAGKYINHMRQVVTNLLPDICQIKPLVLVETSSGAWEETIGSPLTYNGSPNIPCRVDPTQHHREEDVFIQEKIVIDYNLWIPYDAPVEPNHKIYHNDKVFDILRIIEDHSWKLVKQVLIVEVT
jgi:hypothetical protein